MFPKNILIAKLASTHYEDSIIVILEKLYMNHEEWVMFLIQEDSLTNLLYETWQKEYNTYPLW